MALEYVKISQEYLGDFRDLVLTNVLEEVRHYPDMKEEGLFALGTVDSGLPVAAVIGQLRPDNEVYLHSFLVQEDYRGRGIGRELMKGVLQTAYDVFSNFGEKPGDAENVFLHTGYSLPRDVFDSFSAFLKAVGFTEFVSYRPVYVFEANKLRDDPLVREAFMPDFHAEPGVHCCAGVESGPLKEACRQTDAFDMEADPALCFFTGTQEKPDFMIMAAHGAGSDYYVTSRIFARRANQDMCLEALKVMLRAISAENPDFLLLADGDSNEPDAVWEQLAETSGEACPRTEAGAYLTLVKTEN